jgi:restriction system protein
MTVVDAALQILGEAGEPLHYAEICRRILERGLWVPKTKTPAATVGAQLYTDLKKGAGSRFRAAGKGLFASRSTTSPARALGAAEFEDQPPPELRESCNVAAATRAGTVSFTDAAEQILEQSGAHRPMHYREITERAVNRGLISTQGITPEATMRAQIGVEIQRQEQRGERPRFFRLPKGLIGLNRWRGKGDLQSQVEKHNLEVRRKLHDRLLTMKPADFEVLVSELLANLGFQTTVTKPSGDGGIDVRGTLVVGEVIRTRMAVQVKRWAKNVQTPTVQQVRGSLGAHEQGLIITTSDFSAGARKEAARSDATPVALMNGEELVKLLMQNQLGVRRSQMELFELGEGEDDA